MGRQEAACRWHRLGSCSLEARRQAGPGAVGSRKKSVTEPHLRLQRESTVQTASFHISDLQDSEEIYV